MFVSDEILTRRHLDVARCKYIISLFIVNLQLSATQQNQHREEGRLAVCAPRDGIPKLTANQDGVVSNIVEGDHGLPFHRPLPCRRLSTTLYRPSSLRLSRRAPRSPLLPSHTSTHLPLLHPLRPFSSHSKHTRTYSSTKLNTRLAQGVERAATYIRKSCWQWRGQLFKLASGNCFAYMSPSFSPSSSKQRNRMGAQWAGWMSARLAKLSAEKTEKGCFITWTRSAFALLDEVFGTSDKVSRRKKGPLSTTNFTNPNINHLITRKDSEGEPLAIYCICRFFSAEGFILLWAMKLWYQWSGGMDGNGLKVVWMRWRVGDRNPDNTGGMV